MQISCASTSADLRSDRPDRLHDRAVGETSKIISSDGGVAGAHRHGQRHRYPHRPAVMMTKALNGTRQAPPTAPM
jgi:hypothetical protein